MNCLLLKKHVIEKVMKVVSKEVAGLRSKTNPSLLRKTRKGDLENLTWSMFVVSCVKELLFSISSF